MGFYFYIWQRMERYQDITLEKWVSFLKEQLKAPLPGGVVQEKMAPSYRNDYLKKGLEPLQSSVLLLFYQEETQVYLTLIKRSAKLRNHSGQISFPGGKCDVTDKTVVATALRETYEELGIEPSHVKVIGELTSLFIPISNFMVHPFVGYTDEIVVFQPNADEVAEVISMPIQELFNEKSVTKEVWEQNGKIYVRPYFAFKDYKIWGATAMIVSELRDVVAHLK